MASNGLKRVDDDDDTIELFIQEYKNNIIDFGSKCLYEYHIIGLKRELVGILIAIQILDGRCFFIIKLCLGTLGFYLGLNIISFLNITKILEAALTREFLVHTIQYRSTKSNASLYVACHFIGFFFI